MESRSLGRVASKLAMDIVAKAEALVKSGEFSGYREALLSLSEKDQTDHLAKYRD